MRSAVAAPWGDQARDEGLHQIVGGAKPGRIAGRSSSRASASQRSAAGSTDAAVTEAAAHGVECRPARASSCVLLILDHLHEGVRLAGAGNSAVRSPRAHSPAMPRTSPPAAEPHHPHGDRRAPGNSRGVRSWRRRGWMPRPKRAPPRAPAPRANERFAPAAAAAIAAAGSLPPAATTSWHLPFIRYRVRQVAGLLQAVEHAAAGASTRPHRAGWECRHRR